MNHVSIADGCSIQGSIICSNVQIQERVVLKDCQVILSRPISVPVYMFCFALPCIMSRCWFPGRSRFRSECRGWIQGGSLGEEGKVLVARLVVQGLDSPLVCCCHCSFCVASRVGQFWIWNELVLDNCCWFLDFELRVVTVTGIACEIVGEVHLLYIENLVP